MLADKGYNTDPILSHLAERGIRAVIPQRSMRKIQRDFDRTLYRQRNRIERTFAHLKQFRRLATSIDKLKENFQATVAGVSHNMSIHPSQNTAHQFTSIHQHLSIGTYGAAVFFLSTIGCRTSIPVRLASRTLTLRRDPLHLIFMRTMR